MNNIFSIILLVLSVGLFAGFTDPTYEEAKVLALEKAEYERALDNSKELQEERDKLLSRLNTFKTNDLEKLTKLLPDNIDNVRLVIDIDNIASKYGMRVRDFETAAPLEENVVGQDTSLYGTIALTFSTTGTYDTFVAFIEDLERSLRLIDIVSIEFKIPEGEEESNLYDYDVTIKTYWLE